MEALMSLPVIGFAVIWFVLFNKAQRTDLGTTLANNIITTSKTVESIVDTGHVEAVKMNAISRANMLKEVAEASTDPETTEKAIANLAVLRAIQL